MSLAGNVSEGTHAVSLKKIRIDGGTQSRVELNQSAIEDYAKELIDVGADEFPPVDVFYDGNEYWLAHGFHRYHAHVKADYEMISANVHQGTQSDAQWFSYAANKEQDRVGIRRTPNDKARAIRAALAHPNAAKLSTYQIADHVGCTHQYVSKVKSKDPSSNQLLDAPTTRLVTRNGVTYEMDVKKIGVKKDEPAPQQVTPVSPEKTPTKDSEEYDPGTFLEDPFVTIDESVTGNIGEGKYVVPKDSNSKTGETHDAPTAKQAPTNEATLSEKRDGVIRMLSAMHKFTWDIEQAMPVEDPVEIVGQITELAERLYRIADKISEALQEKQAA